MQAKDDQAAWVAGLKASASRFPLLKSVIYFNAVDPYPWSTDKSRIGALIRLFGNRRPASLRGARVTCFALFRRRSLCFFLFPPFFLQRFDNRLLRPKLLRSTELPSLILWIADNGLTLVKHTSGFNDPLRMRPVLSLLLAESLFILFVGPGIDWKLGTE